MAAGARGFDRLAVAIGNKKNDGCFAHLTLRSDHQLELIVARCADYPGIGADHDVGADRADAGHGQNRREPQPELSARCFHYA